MLCRYLRITSSYIYSQIKGFVFPKLAKHDGVTVAWKLDALKFSVLSDL